MSSFGEQGALWVLPDNETGVRHSDSQKAEQ